MAVLSNGRYANVVATLALVVSLGGVGYAATSLPKNSVGSKQIKNGTIKAKDIKPGVVPVVTPPVVPDPGPRASAQIAANGTVTHGKGISAANVTLAGNSLVCLNGLGFTPQSVMAAPALENDDSAHQVSVGFGPNGNLGCPEATQVILSTHTDSGANVRFPLMVQIS